VTEATRPRTLVIGVGNALRGDDALGFEVARRVAERHPPATLVLAHLGDAASLMECWRGDDRVILVDASSAAGAPGTVHRVDLAAEALPASLLHGSSHSMGVREAVELARALGRLPRSLIVYAVEGAAFDAARGLSAEVGRAIASVVEAVLAEIADAPPAFPRRHTESILIGLDGDRRS